MRAMLRIAHLAFLGLAAAFSSVPRPPTCKVFVESIAGVCAFSASSVLSGASPVSLLCQGAAALGNSLGPDGRSSLNDELLGGDLRNSQDHYTAYDLCALSDAARSVCPATCGLPSGQDKVPAGSMLAARERLCALKPFEPCCSHPESANDCLESITSDNTMQSIPSMPLTVPPIVESSDGELNLDLMLSIVDVSLPGGRLYDDAYNTFDRKIYGYNGGGPGALPPIISLKPGDKFTINLHNKMCAASEGGCQYGLRTKGVGAGVDGAYDIDAWHNRFRNFEATNLHTHGLHTDAASPGDNIYILVQHPHLAWNTHTHTSPPPLRPRPVRHHYTNPPMPAGATRGDV